MSSPIPAGTGRLAQMIRDLQREVRRNAIRPGPGMRIRRSSSGTTILQPPPSTNQGAGATKYIAVWL